MSSSVISEKVGGTRQIDLTSAFKLFELRMRENGYDIKDFGEPSLKYLPSFAVSGSPEDTVENEESPLP